MIDRDKLAALHERATKGEWAVSADNHVVVPDRFHCVAITINDFGDMATRENNAALITLLCSESARAEILALMDERDRMREALRALVAAVCYADPPKMFNDVLCHEARVPVEFTADARAALGE